MSPLEVALALFTVGGVLEAPEGRLRVRMPRGMSLDS